MKKIITLVSIVLLANPEFIAFAAARDKNPVTPARNAMTNFAPVTADHPLASLWNDPTFVEGLLGSFGFAADIEPRLSTEEQIIYREKIVPLLREDPARALEELRGHVRPDGSALFDFTLGNLYFQREALTNAIEHFERATLKFPKFRRAWKNLGLALVRDGKYAEAIVPLSKAAALGDTDSKTFGLLAFANMNAGRVVSAESAYRQSLLLEPENLDFRLGLVKCQIATANYDAALAALDELIQLHPQREILWSLQANVFLQKELPARAAANFEVLRRSGTATAENLATLGDIYMTQEARDLALGAYLDAIEKDGGRNPGRALRAAEILISRGAWAEARELFGRMRSGSAASLQPQDEMKLLKLESKVAMANGEGEEGIRVLEQLIERTPLDGEALLLAGDYYARNGQREKAEFRYDAASKLRGFEAEAFLKRAQLLVQAQKYAQATEFLHKAQKLKPRETVQRYLEKVEQLARAGRS